MSAWKEGSLKDIAIIEMGQSPSGDTTNTEGSGYPLLNGPTEFTIKYPFAKQFTTDGKRFSKNNDILFCVRGSTTGRMNWSDQSYAIGRGLASLRHRVGDEYRYYLKGVMDYYLPTLLSEATGSTFPNISKDQLHNLEISIPPLPEQKAIADVLSALDDKIDLLQRQNETLEKMAETLFRQWFIEEAKEDWEEYELSDLCKIITKGTTPKKFSDSGINFIKVEALTESGEVIINKLSHIDLVTHENQLKRSILEEDDLLLSIAGTIGRVAKVTAQILPANTNQALAILRPKDKIYTNLIYCFLRSKSFQDTATAKIVHAVQPNLSLGEIGNTVISLPSKVKIEQFVTKADVLLKAKDSNTNQIQTLQNLRDTLLPKLMSGEVRVKLD